ncbi:MAG: hypothetical protein ACK5CA_15290 [Cyanobacteriota bacterium]|jgi:hypothetical protein
MTVTRKIGFYSLQVVSRSDAGNVFSAFRLREVVNYIVTLAREDRRWDATDRKFFFLSDADVSPNNPNIETWIFKGAEHGYRPPLLNSNTLQERDNPRQIDEGDMVKTHLGLCYYEDEIILVLEEIKSGININRISRYLESFAGGFYHLSGNNLDFKIRYSSIPKENFLEELQKLRRVRLGYVSVSRQLLGSEFLNFSDRIHEIKKEINIEIKANRMGSILEPITDIYNRFAVSNQEIKKIRVYGLDENDHEILLDTEIIKRIQHIELQTNILTGEIDSQEMIDHILHILLLYNNE